MVAVVLEAVVLPPFYKTIHEIFVNLSFQSDFDNFKSPKCSFKECKTEKYNERYMCEFLEISMLGFGFKLSVRRYFKYYSSSECSNFVILCIYFFFESSIQ